MYRFGRIQQNQELMRYLYDKSVFLILFLSVNFITTKTRAGNLPDSIPNGWRAGNRNGQDIVLGTDLLIKHTGRSSGFIKRDPKPVPANGVMMQSIVADQYRNKRVRLSVYLKSEDVQSAHIFFTVQSPDSAIAYANTRNEAIHETTDWTLCQLTLDIPGNSRNMDFGVILFGQGVIWVDDCKLEIVDVSGPSDDMIAKGLVKKQKLTEQNSRLNSVARNLDFEDQD